MKTITKQALALLLSVIMLLTAVPLPALAEEQTDRAQTTTVSAKKREIKFNEDWKFNLGDVGSAQSKEFGDGSWKTVSIPHDFSITQSFTTSGTEVESGWLPGGTGWYRKHFTVSPSAAGKSIVLNFDGAYQHTYVYVNGSYVGENHYGYNNFAFDISDYLVCDGVTDNVIAVKVVHQLSSSRWYSGSGIYRDVTLIVTDPVHVATNGTYVTTPNLESERGGSVTVNAATQIVNDSPSETVVTLSSTVLNAQGYAVSETVTNTVTAAGNATTAVSSSLQVYAPELWSIESPALYILKTEVSVDNQIVDTYYTDFGFRYFKFDANKGFYLNGKAVKLKGVCMHHDQGALGAASYDDAMERQLMILRDMGVNAIRTSHNMADKDFIRMCNKYGFLVMEEAFDGWSAAKNGNTHDFSEYFNKTISADNRIIDGRSGETWAEFVLKSMVLRDRNDPCIFMWDIGNEITNIIGNGNTSQYPTYTTNMISWVQSLDKTRPITHGDNNGKVTTSSTGVTAKVDRLIAESGGVVGFNYYVKDMATTHKYYPNWKLIATESVSSINSRGAYSRYNSNGNLYQSSAGPYVGNAYDNYCVFWGTTAHDGWYQVITNDYVSGEFCWTGFDYIGEPTPWWRTEPGTFSDLYAAPNSSYFGAIDTAGFPKDKYYFYRSQWNDKDTTLHLVTAWDADNQYVSRKKTPVWIYSNAPKVELFRVDSQGTTVKLATATRKVTTTAAGHSYGTYTTTVNNSTYCSKITTSGATALSARVNVTYTPGTIYAVAYDANGNVIERTVGNSRVNTPGAAAKINAYADKSEILADGYSLSYITLDVTDSNGNLDTAAKNRIELSLSGEGEIVGVDNGDPATLRKYQQSSVLTSSKTANIDAYAGKALVIVRSTKTAGSFTLTASATGLSGDSVSVGTIAVPQEIFVETVTLSEESLEMKVGETHELTATVTPENATEQTVVWTSSDPEIVTVEDGLLTANAPGTVMITATVDEISAECEVTVVEAAPDAEEILLDVVSLNLAAGETATLTATIVPEEASEAEITWSSSDEAIATVAEGVVTAVAPGTAVVTATVGEVSAECVVTVTEKAVTVTGIQLSETNLTVSVNAAATLTAVITPEEAASAKLTWKSSDETIATVQDGVIIGVAPGTAVVTASADGIYAECLVTVAETAVETVSITLSQNALSLNVNETAALTAVVTPETGAEVIWSSSDSSVATVSGGVVTAIAPGTAVVTASVDGVYAECLITVAEAAVETVSITLSQNALSLNVNETVALTAVVTPGTGAEVIWSSSDSSVATVSGGVVTAIAPGTAVVTAAVDGASAQCMVTVAAPAPAPVITAIEVSQRSMTMNVGETAVLTAAVTPADAAANVLWYTSAPNVATINNGTITAIAEGETIITAVAGEYNASCRVTVQIPSLEPEKLVPEVSVNVTFANGKTTVTGQSDIGVNPSLYHTEIKHGILYIVSSQLGSRNLLVSTSGATNKTISDYGEDGSFGYTFKPLSSSTAYSYRAYVYYEKADGSRVYEYSPLVRGAGRSFSVG